MLFAFESLTMIVVAVSKDKGSSMHRMLFAVSALALALLAPTTIAGELRVLNSRHYKIHTDLDRALAEDLARRLDAMYEEYARRLSNFAEPDRSKKFDVYLYSKQNDFVKLTKGQSNNSAGVTIPELNIVAAYLGEGRDELRSTLQHEAFHQFAHSVIAKQIPPWVDEGLAVLFGEGIWTGRQFLLGQVPPRRVRQLKYDVENKRLVKFSKMMSMSLDDWNSTLARDKQAGGVNYNQAWAMCQFLVYAAEQGKPKYRVRFLEMLQRIHDGESGDEAFKASFSSNIDGFEQRFIEWARKLQPTRDAALIERQGVLAAMMIEYSKRIGRPDDFDEFQKRICASGLYFEYSRDGMRWTSERDTAVYFRTPDGQPYDREELFFTVRSGAPLPDLVQRGVGQLKLRTRFHDTPRGGIEPETLVEE
jgi:hypothetical protein